MRKFLTRIAELERYNEILRKDRKDYEKEILKLKREKAQLKIKLELYQK